MLAHPWRRHTCDGCPPAHLELYHDGQHLVNRLEKENSVRAVGGVAGAPELREAGGATAIQDGLTRVGGHKGDLDAGAKGEGVLQYSGTVNINTTAQ